MKQVLSAIWAIAGNDDVKDAIVNTGGTDLIVLAMSHHLASPQVYTSMCAGDSLCFGALCLFGFGGLIFGPLFHSDNSINGAQRFPPQAALLATHVTTSDLEQCPADAGSRTVLAAVAVSRILLPAWTV